MKQAERKVAVGLVRCSTDMQDHSIEDQESEIRSWADEQGFDLLQVFRDEGISGSELDRPGIRALLAFLESSPEKGTLVAWHRSRLARPSDPRQGIALELKIEDMGWNLLFLHGSQASGNVLVDAMMGLMEHHKNGQYLKDLSADTLRSLLKRITSGDVPGGKVPYGYAKVVTDSAGQERTIRRTTKHRKLSEERVRWVPGDPEEVEVVRRMFELYASGAGGYAAIAKILNGEGKPSPNGGTWCNGTIRDMLTNPVYVGDLIWNRESTSRFFRVVGGKLTPQKRAHRSSRPARKRTTTYQANHPDDWIRIENHHEALVERSTFEKVREVMKKRGQGRGRKRGQKAVHPLSGIAFCACCSKPMYGRTKKAKTYTYRRYACSSYEKARECAPNNMDADLFELGVISLLKEKLLGRWAELFATNDEEALAELRGKILAAFQRRFQTDRGECAVNRGALRREEQRLAQKIQQAIENMGVVGPELAPKIAEQIGAWERRRVEIDHELAKETGREEERRLQLVNVEDATDEALEMLRSLAELGRDSALDAKREFFERAVERVELEYRTIPPLEGRTRPKHMFVGASVQATDLLGVTQEVELSDVELLGRDSNTRPSG